MAHREDGRVRIVVPVFDPGLDGHDEVVERGEDARRNRRSVRSENKPSTKSQTWRRCRRGTPELAKYQEGTTAWEVVNAALEFCSEIPPILEAAEDWSSAWSSVVRVTGGFRLFGGPKRQMRSFGRNRIMDRVVLSLQTGRLMPLKVPFKLPKHTGVRGRTDGGI